MVLRLSYIHQTSLYLLHSNTGKALAKTLSVETFRPLLEGKVILRGEIIPSIVFIIYYCSILLHTCKKDFYV